METYSERKPNQLSLERERGRDTAQVVGKPVFWGVVKGKFGGKSVIG